MIPVGEVRAGVYCRISRDATELGKGVDRQLEDCLAIAQRLGWAVVDHYIDNNRGASYYSKSRHNRQEYYRLLEDIKAGRINAVVVWIEDRLQREVIETAHFVKTCREAGCTRLASAGGETDLTDPDQVTILYMKARFAEAEVEKLSRRRKRQEEQDAKEGKLHRGGRRPYGEVWFGKQQVSEEQAQLERELIIESVRRIIAGDSLRAISVTWQEHSIRISNVNLRRTLMSPRLVGAREWNGQLFFGKSEPVISIEDRDAVIAILTDPERSKHLRGGLPRHLLTGIAVCGLCGTRLSVRNIRGKRVYYCSPVVGGCNKISRQADPMEHLVTEAIFVATESDLFQRLTVQKEHNPMQELYEQLARDQGLLDRLEDKVAQELIKPETARRNRSEIERRMEDTRREIARKRGSQIMTLVPGNLREVWPTLSLDRQRNIVKAVLAKVVVHAQAGGSRVFHPEKIEAVWRA
jgi:DNA invertase Pin-like site-specific DNA recombinase